MNADDETGIELSRSLFAEVIGPHMATRWPRLSYAAGRLGAGSDVLGFDDETSRDHDWGLRLSLFVPADAVSDVRATVGAALPDEFRGYPTRFAFTGERTARDHIDTMTVSDFLVDRLGFDPRDGVSVHDWLSVTGQAALEVTAGPIFADTAGELRSARDLVQWYPDDIWRYALACDWDRIGQELPFVGRTADVGDDVGSRLVTARLVHIVMHLTFLVGRRWPPYSKWFGSAFATLSGVDDIGSSLTAALDSADAPARQRHLADALQVLADRQRALGLTSTRVATIPFWDRPYIHPDPAIAAELRRGIADAQMLQLPAGHGTVEQRTDNVDILTSPTARRRLILDERSAE